MEKTIGFIGGGRITRIFLQAFGNKRYKPGKVFVTDVNEAATTSLLEQFPFIEISDLQTVASQDIVFIALHPPVIMETLEKIKDVVKPVACMISLAPKITIEKISAKLNGLKSVARLIPNATSVINKGYNPVCFSTGFSNKDEIMGMLSLLGKTFSTEEPKLEPYAIISAMLPTYFWFQWQELLQVGVKIGLNEKESKEAVAETLIASIALMFDSGLTYEEVVDLIPVKPISASEPQIKEIYSVTLNTLFEKIKP
ncbi:MAG: NAD(P)-binding domain-containing protein [Bacteroidota bacterium]